MIPAWLDWIARQLEVRDPGLATLCRWRAAELRAPNTTQRTP